MDALSGTYQVGYDVAPKYQYDSASQSILGLDRNCFQPVNCPADTATGTLNRLSFPLFVEGDGTRSMPGYRAGQAGFLDLLGSFSFSGQNNPTPVPAPGMLLLFGLGALTLFNRRRFGKVVRA